MSLQPCLVQQSIYLARLQVSTVTVAMPAQCLALSAHPLLSKFSHFEPSRCHPCPSPAQGISIGTTLKVFCALIFSVSSALTCHTRISDMRCAMLSVPAGLLQAYSAAVLKAASFLSASPQLPRTNSTLQPDQTISQLMDDPVHLIMGASNSLLLMWSTIYGIYA